MMISAAAHPGPRTIPIRDRSGQLAQVAGRSEPCYRGLVRARSSSWAARVGAFACLAAGCLGIEPGLPRIERAVPERLATATRLELRIEGANLDPRRYTFDADRGVLRSDTPQLGCILLAPGDVQGPATCELADEGLILTIERSTPPAPGIYGVRLEVDGAAWAEERVLFELQP